MSNPMIIRNTSPHKDNLRKPRPAARSFSLLGAGILLCTPVSAETAGELLSQADRLADQSNWYSAAPLYAKAEVEFRQVGDHRQEMYARLGRLHRDVEVGSYTTVRAEAEKELATPIVQNDPQLKIRALALVGNIDMNVNTAEAIEDWKQILAIATVTNDKKWQNRAKGQLGLTAGLNGDMAAAAMALYQAISTAEKLGDVSGHVYFATWLANGMAVHGMADRAVPLLDRAIELAEKSGYSQMPLQLSIAKIRALALLPEPKTAEGREQATKLLAKTLAEAQKDHIVGAETDLLSQAGELALQTQDYAGAERSFHQAADIAKDASLPRMEAGALLELSRIYREEDQLAKASLVIRQAVQIVQRAEQGYDLPLFIAEEAEVQAARGSIRSADALYDRATSLVEGLLVNAPTSQVKSGMIAAMSDIYVGHFRLVWDRLHDGPRAFRIIEGARGRTLLDSIRYARQSGAVTTETAADLEIARLQRALLHERFSAVQTRRILAQLDDAYDRMIPIDYANERKEMHLLRRPPVTLAVLQGRLAPNETFVEYVLDKKTSYALEVTKTGMAVHTLPGRTEIGQSARSFVAAVRSQGDCKPSAQALYLRVISPAVVGNPTSLIVVPDGPLHLVPFGALMDAKGAYLDQQMTLSAAPSATVYCILKAASHLAAASKPFLGVASSPTTADNAKPSTAANEISQLRGADLKPLQFGREEIIEAAKALGPGSVTLDGSAATEAALKAQPLADFKVIHLAAHGISNELEPERAALLFAPGRESEDGLWQAREIRHTRLKADAVVLSACETGSGRLQGQEGVMNLARAFLTAGAKSVVASLWAVDDRSTATVMESFYQHLRAGLDVSDSLRQAQLDFIRDYKEKAKPYFWAGFVVIGDGTRRINFETNKTDRRTAHSDFR